MTDQFEILEQARQDLALALPDLWFRYFALGGMSTALEVEAILYGALIATNHNHDLIAVALNERFSEVGEDHPLAYVGDDPIAQ
ncbi:MAG: hypothetical protein ACR2MB_03725 [Acidimicrobiales bacterium]